MKISIIIPAYNERETIAATLNAISDTRENVEIIVVDGGSSDGTPHIAASLGVRCLSASRGRASQMNAGAASATGDVLLFLHADTFLPSNFETLITNALSDPGVAGGCFRLQFDCDRGLLHLCSLSTRFSAPLLHYGDSAYFVRADVFKELGGYRADFPIMEDVDFFLRMTKSHKHVILNANVISSARRFKRDGVVRRQLINILLVTLFLLGVHPRDLSRFYDRNQAVRGSALSPKIGSLVQKLWYSVRTFWHWTYSNAHLVGQTYYVLDFMKLHSLRACELPPTHPWVTGVMPNSREVVWDKNIVYASQRKSRWLEEPESDEAIAVRLGRFLSLMVRHSVVPIPELPQGSKRRMPHGVNYIHGSIHYNGGLLIFNDFADGMRHISDTAFVREMKRFAREQRRELTIVLRERSFDPEEFAWFVTFVRSHIPWFANGNGPTQKRVLFGTPSPYAAVNPINGSWVKDLQLLYRKQIDAIVRPPISSTYFTEEYCGTQTDYTFLERFHAWAQHVQIRSKGFQGGLVFTSRRRIEPENYRKYQETDGLWRASYPVSHPFARIERVRARRQHLLADNASSDVRAIARNAANAG